MSPSEALTVKPDDILTSIFETARYQKGEEFIVKYLHRYSSGITFDRGADLVSLRTGNEICSNLGDFVFADVTKSFRTSKIWRDYIRLKYITSEDSLLDYINNLDKRIRKSKSKVEIACYENEKNGTKVLLDILNGHRDKYGIELCAIL